MGKVGLVRLLPLLAVLTACSSPAPTATSPTPVTASVVATTNDPAAPQSRGHNVVRLPVDNRPVLIHVPTGFSHGPLVIGLHGYGGTGAEFESYVHLTAQSDQRGFLYALPDGTTDSQGSRFWNATDACCDLYGAGVDDSTYLSHLISSVRRYYAVDRVFLVGYSNGAFMAMRMACDHADQITAIAGLNGAMWNDPDRCHPSRPVSVLDMRSTADARIRFGGGAGTLGHDGAYPSAAATDADWRSFDRCLAVPVPIGAPLDLARDVAGAETRVISWPCAAGTSVAAWTLAGAVHNPDLSDRFAPAVMDFLYAQSQP